MKAPTALVTTTLSAIISACLACAAGPPSTDGEASVDKAEHTGGDASMSKELRAKICATDHVDSSSEVFLASDPNGEVRRVVVTPSSNIADMGNLIFDMDGKLLGHDTGGEFPWEDKAALAEEQQRVAELMDGATISDDQKSQSCG